MNIKPTKLSIKNIGKIAESTITIDKPLILFYGEIKMGKSTILNCVRWVCGGAFPADIIRHEEKEGAIELHFDGGMIGRSFYRAADGVTKARPVIFIRNGKPVSSPVNEIKRFLNPFLLDQDFLRNKSELERAQYFTELFAVDTTALDNELFNSQRDAQQLRAKIFGYGQIDLAPVDRVDVDAVRSKLVAVRGKHSAECVKVSVKNRDAVEHNSRVRRAEESKALAQQQIADLKANMDYLLANVSETATWLAEHPKQDELQMPAAPDTAELERQLQDAGAQNVRAEQYQWNVKRAEAKRVDEMNLSALEKRGREIKSEKMKKLKSISKTCGIDGLEFDEAGNFIYQGATAGMISDSQIMTLSCELSKLYPEGFDLSLIDRAESLGKSIFEFVDRAKAEKKTILATIVGERPATVPPEIGVFVVDDGKVTQ